MNIKKYSIKINLIFWAIFTLLCATPVDSQGREAFRRLGLGMTNQAANEITCLSVKMQTSKYFAFGGVFGFDTGDTGGQVAGIKIFQNFIADAQLNFYGSTFLAYLNQKSSGSGQSGFQVDLTLGSEFSFLQLNDIGFSFEFGLSMINVDDFTMKTVGNNMITAAVHFYL